MAIFIKRVTRAAAAFAAVGVMLPIAAGAGSLSDRVDKVAESIDDLESKVQSTLLSGGSSPVSFSGEARLKVQYHNLGYDAPAYMRADRSYLQSGWEGNENLYRLGMVARPGRNTVLWSKIGFQHTLTGNQYYGRVFNPGTPPISEWSDSLGYPYQYRHDKARNSITIHEDMAAGIAVRTVPASFWVKLGNTLWTEASPLTVWKSQPRNFAWEYLPFEVEQPIARYYEYNIAKGEKAGRAAWNKRPFNGINVESINLPADIYANFVYGTFERYDNFEREYVDFAGDLAYADGEVGNFPAKGYGIGDSYRHVIHGRIAKSKMFGDMTLGLNYVGIDYKEYDAPYVAKFDEGAPVYLYLREFQGDDSIFFKEPKTVSVDLRGPIAGPFSMHADLALNWTDTVWMIDDVPADEDPAHTPENRAAHPEWYKKRVVGEAEFVPAFYSKLTYNGKGWLTDSLMLDLDLAWISQNFYSPFSFATPMDAFYAFGTNMVGAGKFIARGEGSPYTQNMAGVNLTYTPKLPGYGHMRLKYGQHWNIEDGRDLLFFPHRLNGSDMFSFYHSSFNRWGNGLIDNSVKSGGRKYLGRLGDESFLIKGSYNTNGSGGGGVLQVAGPGAGGLRSDYLSMFEGFVTYNNPREAYLNWRSSRTNATASNVNQDLTLPGDLSNYTTINNQSLYVFYPDETGDTVRYETNTSWVPVSKKNTFNLEFDAAYDIGASIGYKKDLFVGGYAGISGVTRGMAPLAFSETGENNLLWSFYMRLEPAIALRKNFYVLGLFGFENWRSDKSWMMVAHSPDYSRVLGVRNATSIVVNPTGGAAYNTGTTGNAAPVSERDFVKVPIDYRDFAYGIGFDWDVLERVGLHGRFKVISHTDKGLNDKYEEWGIDATPSMKNDWVTPVVSFEVKTWF
ncbi:MAG: hypothetical protein LBH93_07515 [Chitinispirillales bacterium]|nr:hypothetical protein [Chitinispirillales bacterium]